MTNTSKYFVLFVLSLLDDILTLYYSITTWVPIRARRVWFLFQWYALPVIRERSRAFLLTGVGILATLAILSYYACRYLASSARAGWAFRAELISEWN